MISYKDWKVKMGEMVGTGAIYNGEKAQSSTRDYNWWGDPASSEKITKKNKRKFTLKPLQN